MNSVPKLFSCSYADCWTEKHFSTEFGVLTPNHTHSHTLFWGCVSRWFGRALAWHARGHRDYNSPVISTRKRSTTQKCVVLFCQGQPSEGLAQLGERRAWTARGHRFDPAILHQKSTVLRLKYGAFLFDFLETASRISQMPDFAGAWTTTPNSF